MLHSLTRLVLALALLSTLIIRPANAQFARVSQESNVTIRVVDETGKLVECVIDSFRERNRRSIDLASHFKLLNGSKITGSSIPYGSYVYSLRRCDSGPKSEFAVGGVSGADIIGEIQVFTPEVFEVAFTLRTPGETGTPPGYVLNGRLDPVPARSETSDQGLFRIRLAPIDDSRHLDVPVEPSGEFKIYKALLGRYILIVVRGTEVLHTE